MPNANFQNAYGQPPGYIESYDKSKNYEDVTDSVLDYDFHNGADQRVETRTGRYGFGVLTRYKRPQALIGKIGKGPHSAGFHYVEVTNSYTMSSYHIYCYLPSASFGDGQWCLVVPADIRRKSNQKLIDGIITAIFDEDPRNSLMLFGSMGRGNSW